MEEEAIFSFDSPKGQSSYIKVIGVGGGGGNAVNHMFRQGIQGVDFIVCNTDMKALNSSPVPNKIVLGDLGLGAGNKPERARKAALDKADDIREILSHNTQMLFITAGMGGGTGTGAAPVIAEIAKSIDLDGDEDTKKILVVAIVTLPFTTEGRRRREQAEAGIVELSKHVDSILVINNDKLLSYKDFTLSKAFGMANDVLLTAAKGIAEIITVDAFVNIDFQDVNTVMENSGTALMGAGSGSGENRAHDAIEAATTSVLLNDNDINGAKNVLLYYSYSPDHEITMEELGEINDYLSAKTNGTADVIWGAGADESLGDELKVTLIATGFEKKAVIHESPRVQSLDDTPVDAPQKPTATQTKPDEEGIVVIHNAEAAKPVETPVAVIEEPVLPKDEVAKPEFEIPAIEVTTPAPVNEVAPQPKPQNVVVYTLEDDDETPAPVATRKHEAEKKDTLVEDIVVMPAAAAVEEKVAPEPKWEESPRREPVRASVEEMTEKAFRGFNDVKLANDRAERIRFIHDQLLHNPNGAEVVQRMSPLEVSEGGFFEGHHSSDRESSSFTMRPDGTVYRNPHFDDQSD